MGPMDPTGILQVIFLMREKKMNFHEKKPSECTCRVHFTRLERGELNTVRYCFVTDTHLNCNDILKKDYEDLPSCLPHPIYM